MSFKIYEDGLDFIPSASTSVKIQITGGKVTTLLGDVNIFFVFKSLLTMPSNVLFSRSWDFETAGANH
jgi:hypothetical protein